MLMEKTIAPNFILPDQNSREHALSNYRGQWVLLYFYPQDDTPGCTTEACSFQDNLPDFEKFNIKVIGISSDAINSHKDFAQKYGLHFTLLSDDKKEVINQYGAGGVFTKRISYLINPEGNIYKTYPKVNPETHAKEVLADLAAAGMK